MRRGCRAAPWKPEVNAQLKVVVLGGYGNFGARISRALAGDARIELFVAGRSAERARAFARGLGRGVQEVVLDTGSSAFEEALRGLRPGLVIHTAGPFQGQAYRVAEAAAAAGAHYVDLADGRRFVCDFAAALDARFKAARRLAVCGASTVPALSAAVVDAHRGRFAELHGIEVCIAPAQQAPRGEATLAGVLSYCGEPIEVWQQGRWQRQHGWARPRRVRFAHMRPRLGALCDIPDLELFPQRYAGVRDVMFRAALEVGLTQRALSMLALARGLRLLPPVSAFAPWLHRSSSWFDRLGTELGGMVVRMRGVGSQGGRLSVEWHISADRNHGPEIPCMPAILLARKLSRGELPTAGAQPCMDLLQLSDFEPEFARWGMRTEVIVDGA
jgi:hypothetical protein